MKNYLLTIRYILWLTLAIFIGIVLWRVVAPSGKVNYEWINGSSNEFISQIKPNDRLNNEKNLELKGSPVYFNVRAFRPFSKLKLTIDYINKAEAPFMEAGLLVEGKSKNYTKQPLDLAVLNNLANNQDWKIITEKGLTLYTKNQKIKSVEEFLRRPPALNKIAVYNYRWQSNWKMPGYKVSGYKQTVGRNLQGAWQAWVYLKNEPLFVRMLIKDLKQNTDKDNAVLVLRDYQGKEIARFTWNDKNLSEGDGEATAPEEFKAETAKLPEGLYKLEWQANDDLVVELVESKQNKFSYIGKLKFGDSDRGQKLWVKAPNLAAQTDNPKGMQSISGEGGEMIVDDTYKQFTANLPCRERACLLSLERGDILVAANGVMAYSGNFLIEPPVENVDEFFVLDDKIEYILANYQEPKELSDKIKTAQAEFDLADAYYENGQYGLILSVPGLDYAADTIEIKKIKVELEGTSLWQKIKNIF